MKLTVQQITLLEKAMAKLEAADSYQQAALGATDLCEDLHYRIEEILAEIEMLVDETETA
jgi:uncharacterized protein YlxP (DUF503 family)